MFDFSQSHQQRASELSGPWPYIEPASRARVKAALASGCTCKLVATPTATLRRRTTQGSTSIWLQCDGCGHAIGSATPRQHHRDADRYPAWDEELARAYEAAQQAFWSEQRAAIPSPDLRREQRIQEYIERSREYEAWLRTSPAWAQVRERVLQRARGWCEACLSQSASHVHHLTYAHGKIPPAWELRAVCRSCHERLHTAGDDWCALGMER